MFSLFLSLEDTLVAVLVQLGDIVALGGLQGVEGLEVGLGQVQVTQSAVSAATSQQSLPHVQVAVLRDDDVQGGECLLELVIALQSDGLADGGAEGQLL